MTLRGAALFVHRYVGLAMTVFLMVAGLTGSLLAFRQEIDKAANPQLFLVEASAAPSYDPLALRDILLQRLPDGSAITTVDLQAPPGHATSLSVQLPPEAEGADNQYFMHPATGEILGSRRWGDISQGIVNLMPFVFELHHSLAIGDVGSWLLGVVAVLWTVDCFVGAYLTFPLRRHLKGSARASSPSSTISAGAVWLLRWGRAWALKTKKLFSLVFTWHRATGLWLWAVLLVFAWSGVGLNLYEQVYGPVMHAAFDMPETAYDKLPKLEQPRLKPALDFRAAHLRGRELLLEASKKRGFQVLAEYRLRYSPQSGHYQLRTRSNFDIVQRYPQTSVWFDGDTGKLLSVDIPNRHTGDTVSNWLFALHFGTWAAGGLAYRIFVSVLGTVIATLAISGAWIWWRKRERRLQTPP